EGVPRDDAWAAELLRRAAAQGHAEAQYRLGECLLQGRGVKKDEAQARRGLSEAADQGHAGAHQRLRGVNPNPGTASSGPRGPRVGTEFALLSSVPRQAPAGVASVFEEGTAMNTEAMHGSTLALTADERRTLVEVLEDVLKETQVELHRTEAFGAKEVVGHRAA